MRISSSVSVTRMPFLSVNIINALLPALADCFLPTDEGYYSFSQTPSQLRQLGNVRRNPSRLILAE